MCCPKILSHPGHPEMVWHELGPVGRELWGAVEGVWRWGHAGARESCRDEHWQGPGWGSGAPRGRRCTTPWWPEPCPTAPIPRRVCPPAAFPECQPQESSRNPSFPFAWIPISSQTLMTDCSRLPRSARFGSSGPSAASWAKQPRAERKRKEQPRCGMSGFGRSVTPLSPSCSPRGSLQPRPLSGAPRGGDSSGTGGPSASRLLWLHLCARC